MGELRRDEPAENGLGENVGGQGTGSDQSHILCGRKITDCVAAAHRKTM
jgi:hypothetical protein